MPISPLASSLFSSEQFDKYSARWLEVVRSPDPQALRACFTPNQTLLSTACFPVQDMLYLLSSVGTVSIKAQFVVTPIGGVEQFTVVLSGVNGLNARTSAYFVANTAPGGTFPVNDTVVPDSLASQWLDNWANVERLGIEHSSALFATSYGPLRGFTFPMEDFLKPIASVPSGEVDSAQLRINFGLHNYFPPEATTAKDSAYLFGLALNISGLTEQSGIDDPYYDISSPCPPTC